ncbi:MAG: exo-alpha-sialidase [Ignavibacteria bacterium]|nr:exo-alpha-sialidase [Ignavibacteria bacterium]
MKLFIFSILLVIIMPVTGKYFFKKKVTDLNQGAASNVYTGTNYLISPSPYVQVEISAYSHPVNSNVKVASAITDFYEGGYTTGFYISTNNGMNWTGTPNIKNTLGNTIVTVGDPSILISQNGNFIMTYIAPSVTSGADLKAGACYSTNNGANWSSTIYIPGVDTADKPISETDNILSSPYLGRSYLAYDEMADSGEVKGVFLSYSTNGGVSWDSSKRITNVNPLYKYRLISDVSVGINGELNVLWYTRKNNLGFAKSTNGSSSWIINNDLAVSTDSTVIFYEYNDIYLTGVPSLESDVTGGIRNGWMYIVNIEKSSDLMYVVLHRSTDSGLTWNYKKKVNQDSTGSFKIQTKPVLNVDKYGGINSFYYDTRNSVSNDSFEVYLSRSVDGGNSFQDTKISDHKFKLGRTVIPLFSYDQYIGSYIAAVSGDDKIIPLWYDNSSGIYQTYTTSIELLPGFEIKIFPEGFYNLVNNRLRMKDTVRVYLRNPGSPFAVIDSSKGPIDSVSFNASLKFNPGLASGNYYLEMKHRNSLETWSSAPVNYSFGSKVFYDFTTSVNSAYGDNMKSVSSKWGIYSGDVDQNGYIDLVDVLSVYNESNNFLTGYVVQDCNGDSIVDLIDVLIAYNNAQLFVATIVP